MITKTWTVKAYIEYEIEASTEEEAIIRLGEIIQEELDKNNDIRDIAEVGAEMTKNGPMEQE